MTCPACGKEAKRGSVHFSFSERGGFCFVCQFKAGLGKLAEMYGLDGGPSWAPPPPRPLERRIDKRAEFARWCAEWARNPRAAEAWQSYKPLPEQVIRARALGLGRFPKYASKCQHERLMVPIYEDGEIVGIRGRSLGCDCGKWLSPSSSRCVLYNAEHLPRAAGKVLWILENPIDALMLELRVPQSVAVATLGVTLWQDVWTERLVAAKPFLTMVTFDNDRPGNGGGEAGKAAWLATHEKDIEPNGVRLCNRLLVAGLRARLFDWGDAPLKADIGDVLMKEVAA